MALSLTCTSYAQGSFARWCRIFASCAGTARAAHRRLPSKPTCLGVPVARAQEEVTPTTRHRSRTSRARPIELNAKHPHVMGLTPQRHERRAWRYGHRLPSSGSLRSWSQAMVGKEPQATSLLTGQAWWRCWMRRRSEAQSTNRSMCSRYFQARRKNLRAVKSAASSPRNVSKRQRR